MGFQYYPTLKVASDDRHLLLVYEDRIDVLDTTDGATRRTFFFDRNIVDVDLLEPDSKVLVTMDHAWKDNRVSTRVSFMASLCSSHVTVYPSGLGSKVIHQHGGFGHFWCSSGPGRGQHGHVVRQLQPLGHGKSVTVRPCCPCSPSPPGRCVAPSPPPNQVADPSCRCDPLSGGTLGEG